MSASSPHTDPLSLPRAGMLRERLASSKSEWLADVLGKDDSWVRKLRNGECGIMLVDLPVLLHALKLKVVDDAKVCVRPDIARAYDTIVGRLLASNSLLLEDAE